MFLESSLSRCTSSMTGEAKKRIRESNEKDSDETSKSFVADKPEIICNTPAIQTIDIFSNVL